MVRFTMPAEQFNDRLYSTITVQVNDRLCSMPTVQFNDRLYNLITFLNITSTGDQNALAVEAVADMKHFFSDKSFVGFVKTELTFLTQVVRSKQTHFVRIK